MIYKSTIKRIVEEQDTKDNQSITGYASSKRSDEEIGRKVRTVRDRIDARNELYNLLTEEE